MQERELLIHSAEIAGVFVGFGALIAIRSGATMAAGEINAIRWVMTSGIWVVVAALIPPFIASYGPSGHELFLISSLAALTLLAVILVVFARTPENRAEVHAEIAGRTRRQAAMHLVPWMAPSFWLPLAGLILALAVVALGLLPDQEEALYLTAVGLGLLMSALGLFVGVFAPRRPEPI
ncbi:MAG TPA: hypothetical protein VLA23_05585 [Candidatus Limnocylindrales bacterium]|nr:hypothetical protein [Candidatus Limnocylindrales bacterium]